MALNESRAASARYCFQYAIQHYASYRTSTRIQEEHKREKKGSIYGQGINGSTFKWYGHILIYRQRNKSKF